MKVLMAFAVVGALAAMFGCGSSDATATQTVACLDGITVSPTSASLRAGDTLRIKATEPGCPFNPVPVTYMWSSSNAAVVAVDAGTGLLHAKALGNATITVQRANAPSDKGTVAVDVK